MDDWMMISEILQYKKWWKNEKNEEAVYLDFLYQILVGEDIGGSI
jgi:hypothetical protein